MYLGDYDTNVDTVAYLTLPDGRKIRAHRSGYVEGDTNGFVEGDYTISDEDTGEEISARAFANPATARTRIVYVAGCEILARDQNGRVTSYRLPTKGLPSLGWKVYDQSYLHELNAVKYVLRECDNDSQTVDEFIDRHAQWQDCDCESQRSYYAEEYW